MITERDLQQAIAACHGEPEPNANTCIKLAAYYTIRNELVGNSDRLERADAQSYSHADAPAEPVDTRIHYTSDTDFARAVDGRDFEDVWPVIDELMTTVQVLMPRLYYATMRRLI